MGRYPSVRYPSTFLRTLDDSRFRVADSVPLSSNDSSGLLASRVSFSARNCRLFLLKIASFLGSVPANRGSNTLGLNKILTTIFPFSHVGVHHVLLKAYNLAGFKKALLQNPREMIRGRIFSEMIRVQTRKSELQAKSRSYRPKVRVTAGQTPTSRTESPGKGPRIGFRCFYRKPPLKPSWIQLTYNFSQVHNRILTI